MTRYALPILCALPLALLGQTLDQQAQTQSNNFWNQRATRCADTTYIAYKNGEVQAFKNGQIRVQSAPLSETDRLNGWEWKGATALTATASRSWILSRSGWQDWTPGSGIGGIFQTFNAIMEKRRGVWSITPNQYGPWNEIKPFSCPQVPPERFDPNSASVQSLAKEQTCKQFMAADNLPWDDQRIQGWIQGLDVKTCRDANGRTPLMKAAGDWYPHVNGVRYLLSLGVDVNARDNTGQTALSLTRTRLRGGSGAYNSDSNQWALAEQVVNLLQNATSVGQTAGSDRGTTTATMSIVADPSSGVTLRECSAPLAFVPLKTKSEARFNVANGTSQILRLSKLDSQMRWIPQGEVPLPNGGLGVGTDYAEEIWRIEDSHGTCLKIVGPRQAPYTNIQVTQR